MNLETKIIIYKFTPQVFTLTPKGRQRGINVKNCRDTPHRVSLHHRKESIT